jgi:hypothetical protein
VRPNSSAAITVRVADRVVVPVPAEICTDVEAATGAAVTVKVAVAAPAGTVTRAGRVAAAGFWIKSVTASPPAGAGPFRVTVPVAVPPALTRLGVRVIEVTTGARTCRLTERVTDPNEASMSISVCEATGWVVTVNVAEVEPAGIVTRSGTLAAEGCALESATVAPPSGAGTLRVTVPVTDRPPVTATASSDTEVSGAGRTCSVAL